MLLLWHGSQRQAPLAARGHGTWSSPRTLAEMELGRGGLFSLWDGAVFLCLGFPVLCNVSMKKCDRASVPGKVFSPLFTSWYSLPGLPRKSTSGQTEQEGSAGGAGAAALSRRKRRSPCRALKPSESLWDSSCCRGLTGLFNCVPKAIPAAASSAATCGHQHTFGDARSPLVSVTGAASQRSSCL